MTTVAERKDAAAVPASVVIATFNRRDAAARLLQQLAMQTLDPTRFEVVIVDDGSAEPVGSWLPGLDLPFRVTAVRQANSGPAAARHRGIVEARGELTVITDDDMQLLPGFLEAHLAAHPAGSRRAVIGRIRASARLPQMPVFERFHARLLDRWANRPLHGDLLYTGNMSVRRADYLAVGGFDTSLERAEDADLGIRLELSGVEVAFSDEAATIHESDHTDFAAWRRAARSYGRCGLRIARKYPRVVRADPWATFFRNSLAKRPFVTATLVSPRSGRVLARLAEAAVRAADRVGRERLALALTSLLFDLEFFRGVREEAGGLGGMLSSLAEFTQKAEAGRHAATGVGPAVLWLGRRVGTLARSRRPDAGAPR